MQMEQMHERSLIEVRNLKKFFPVQKKVNGVRLAVKAVNDVSISIRPNEVYGLVGETGCGKSTYGTDGWRDHL